jgi:hypothetical protein
MLPSMGILIMCFRIVGKGLCDIDCQQQILSDILEKCVVFYVQISEEFIYECRDWPRDRGKQQYITRISATIGFYRSIGSTMQYFVVLMSVVCRRGQWN